MLARRCAYLTAVYGTMQMEIDEIEEKQASLDKEIAIVKKALRVTAEFHAKITTGKEGLASTEAVKASLNAEHSRATNTAGLHAVGGTAGFLAPSTPSRSGTIRKPCDSRGSLATRFGRKQGRATSEALTLRASQEVPSALTMRCETIDLSSRGVSPIANPATDNDDDADPFGKPA